MYICELRRMRQHQCEDIYSIFLLFVFHKQRRAINPIFGQYSHTIRIINIRIRIRPPIEAQMLFAFGYFFFKQGECLDWQLPGIFSDFFHNWAHANLSLHFPFLTTGSTSPLKEIVGVCSFLYLVPLELLCAPTLHIILIYQSHIWEGIQIKSCLFLYLASFIGGLGEISIVLWRSELVLADLLLESLANFVFAYCIPSFLGSQLTLMFGQCW